VAWIVLLALLAPVQAPARTLGIDVIGMFPKDVGELAYADLKAARQFPWFAQLKEQMLPSRFRQFEEFLTSAGIDTSTQVEELAWAFAAPTEERGEQLVGVALGQFTPAAAEQHFKQQNLPTAGVRGYTLFAFGDGVSQNDLVFFFLDSNTAVFGHRRLVETLIEVRYGTHEGLLRSEELAPLVQEVNGRGIVWAALGPLYSKVALNQMAPELAQFSDAPKMLAKVRAMLISIQADRNVEARLQAVCETTDDANLFAALLQAGLLYRRFQEQQTNPDLAKLLEDAGVTARGDRLDLSFTASQELMQALIRRNTFALRM
jgi:hypothetical protein